MVVRLIQSFLAPADKTVEKVLLFHHSSKNSLFYAYSNCFPSLVNVLFFCTLRLIQRLIEDNISMGRLLWSELSTRNHVHCGIHTMCSHHSLGCEAPSTSQACYTVSLFEHLIEYWRCYGTADGCGHILTEQPNHGLCNSTELQVFLTPLSQVSLLL